MTLRRLLACGAVALVSVWPLAAAQRQAPAIDSIREADLRTDLAFLASDAMGGRLTATAENAIAAEWIKARFERLGLAPAVPGYFQAYDLATVTLGPVNTMSVTIGGATEAVAHGDGFTAQQFSPTASASGPVVFAGYGITASDLGHDDYRAVDRIRGAIVLVLNHEPGERDPSSPFDGVVTSHLSGALQKAQAAQAAGAAGILFVSDVHNHQAAGGRAGRAGRGAAAGRAATAGRAGGRGRGRGNQWTRPPSRLGRYTLSRWMADLHIPAASVTTDLAERLVAGTGRSLVELARTADTPGGAPATPLGADVSMTISVDRHDIPDRNVLAMVEGRDPDLRDEWIVLSAHYDHDGATETEIFNGADDDGSGTVGLLELAQAFATAADAGQRPRRSVLFAAFDSEERGLLGAWAYTLDPVAPLDRTVANLNMDMIGRDEEVPADGGGGRFNGLEPQTAASNHNALNVIGSVRAPDLAAALDRANAATGLEIRYRYDNNTSQLMRRSDHWPFIQNGVPGVWIFTGLHPDYHRGTDTPDRINYEKMARILKLVYQTTWDLAEADGRPALLPRR